jgi:hypothetical protein
MIDHKSGNGITGLDNEKESGGGTVRNTLDKVTGLARESGGKAQQAVSDTASQVGSEVRGILDRQLSEGWGVAGQVANSFKRAADDLDESSPVAARVVRNLAERVQYYADDFQDQTVDGMISSASSFARRQPAMAFGLGALAGFLLFRSVKSARGPISASRTDQPSGLGSQETSYG